MQAPAEPSANQGWPERGAVSKVRAPRRLLRPTASPGRCRPNEKLLLRPPDRALLPCPPIIEMSHHPKNGEVGRDDSAAERLNAAAEILEMASANRALLAELSVEERKRLLKAAGDIYCPDLNQRRR